MRFVVFIKATEETEAGVMPSEELLTQMAQFNEDLSRAGVLLGGEGIQPSSKGVRVKFSGGERTVVEGPFAETRALVAGFWLWQCATLEEAIEWAKRCPQPTGQEGELEIRPVFELEDFAADMTPELMEREERLRSEVAEANLRSEVSKGT